MEEPEQPRRRAKPAPAAPEVAVQEEAPAAAAAADPEPSKVDRHLRAVAAGSAWAGTAARKALILVFGSSGYGKTTLATRIYAQRFTKGGRCTFVDPTGKYGDLGTVVRNAREWEEEIRAAGPGRCSLVLQPDGSEELEVFWRRVYAHGRLLLVVDEAQNFGNASRIDAGLHRLISQGRHQLVDLVMIVRTPPELPKVAKGNYESIFTFRQTDPDYAAQLNDGFFRLRQGAELIQRLPRLHFLRVDADGGVTRGNL